MFRAVSMACNSANVRTLCTSSGSSSLAASPFLAMHGPMNTTFKSWPWRWCNTRAMATIGDTMGASDFTSSGWYRCTYATIDGHVVATKRLSRVDSTSLR